MSGAENEIRALITLFDDSDDVFSHVREVLIEKYGKDALPFLCDRLTDKEALDNLTVDRINQTIADIRQGSISAGLREWADNGAQDLLEGLYYVALLENPKFSVATLRATTDDLIFEAFDFHDVKRFFVGDA